MRYRRSSLSELPEDLQVLASSFAEDSLGEKGLRRIESHRFRVRRIPVAAFPRVEMWTDYRDKEYSSAMIGQKLPPIIICGDDWLDGRNRVWAAKVSGETTVDCIDLSEVGVKTIVGVLGKIAKRFCRP
jgi:hypothetical protein